MKAKDLAGIPRDSKREREVAAELRSLSPDEAFEAISELVELDHRVGLELANRCLRESRHFEALLRRGIQIADVSNIKYWLRSCITRLGPERLLQYLTELSEENPEGVEKAIYWLPSLLPRRNARIDNLLNALRDEVEG